MQTIQSVNKMQSYAIEVRSRGDSIALVPTMGSLHEGHLKLIDIAKEKADLVIADSIEQCKYRGEIACSIRDGNLKLDNVVELGDVLSGKISGRESKSQITVSDLTGVAVQDIKIADSVFKKFMEDKNEI